MDCSTPGLPVHHQLPEFTQTQVHCVSDAIQPSHPLSSPCPPTFNLSKHQGLFQRAGSSHQVAKVLEFQLQYQSFQWIFRIESTSFLSFIVLILARIVPVVSLIFLKRSLVFPILLFSYISLHWSLRKAFLSLLVILWNYAFEWLYHSFSPLPLASLLFSAVCKASSLTTPKPVWITINCGKFWRRWEYQTTWPASWETCM